MFEFCRCICLREKKRLTIGFSVGGRCRGLPPLSLSVRIDMNNVNAKCITPKRLLITWIVTLTLIAATTLSPSMETIFGISYVPPSLLFLEYTLLITIAGILVGLIAASTGYCAIKYYKNNNMSYAIPMAHFVFSIIAIIFWFYVLIWLSRLIITGWWIPFYWNRPSV